MKVVILYKEIGIILQTLYVYEIKENKELKLIDKCFTTLEDLNSAVSILKERYGEISLMVYNDAEMEAEISRIHQIPVYDIERRV